MIRRLRRSWNARRSAAAVVLLYHRVTTVAEDPQLLAVGPERFAAQMELISRDYRPLSLAELIRLHDRGTLPDRAVAVSFDDGYADNLHEAEPILRRSGVPATVFVTTGQIGKSQEFWWDELERLLLAVARPESLAITVGGEPLSYPTASLPERRAAYDDLHPRLRRESSSGRDATLAELRLWAGEAAEGDHRPGHRAMTVDELRALANSEVVELGAHSRTHPVLASQSPHGQRQELAGSAEDLARWTGHAPNGFSYPYGSPGADYTQETAQLARELGFDYAVSNYPAPLTPYSPRWELPRRLVGDWDLDRFEHFLAGSFSG